MQAAMKNRCLPYSLKALAIFSFTLVVIAVLSFGCRSDSQHDLPGSSGNIYLIAGSYSGEEGNDIHLVEIDVNDTVLRITGGARVGNNPSFLTLSPDGSLLYAVNETDSFSGTESGGITALRYDPADSLLEVAGELSISGRGPCHISTDDDGRFLFVSSYSSGGLSVVANDEKGMPELETVYLDYDGGTAGDSHTHMAFQPGGGHILYVSDLGLDRIMVYHTIHAGNNLILREDNPITLPEGSGPRHFVVDTTGTTLYILNELSSEIIVVKRYITGDYREMQRISTIPPDFSGDNFPADIHWSADYRFIYASNRGHNSISVMEHKQDGTLELKGIVDCGGDWPRNFVLTPDGRFMVVANRKSGTLNLFTLNTGTGIPVNSDSKVIIDSPACVIFGWPGNRGKQE